MTHTELPVKIDLIKKQACFSTLSSEELEGLAQLFEEKWFQEEEVIVKEGDFVDSIFLIISGIVDVRHIRLNQGVIYIDSVATLGPGMAIGLSDTGFYSLSGRRSATVVAIQKVHALRLSVPVFNGFALAHPAVGKVMRQSRPVVG